MLKRQNLGTAVVALVAGFLGGAVSQWLFSETIIPIFVAVN